MSGGQRMRLRLGLMDMCVWVCMCVCVHVCMCVRGCGGRDCTLNPEVCVRARVFVCVFHHELERIPVYNLHAANLLWLDGHPSPPLRSCVCVCVCVCVVCMCTFVCVLPYVIHACT